MVPTLLRRALHALPIYVLGAAMVVSTANLIGDPAPVHAADHPAAAQSVVPAIAPVHFTVVFGPLPLPVLVPAPID